MAEPFRHLVAGEMRKRGLSLLALSMATGIPKPTLHGWINGRQPKSIEQVRSLASFLGIPVGVLLGYQELDCNSDFEYELILVRKDKNGSRNALACLISGGLSGEIILAQLPGSRGKL